MSLIPDHTWAKWAEELVQLQKDNPEISKKVIFYEAFKNFDASTGFDLPYRDEQIVNIAVRLLSRENSAEAQAALVRAKYQVQRTPAEIDGYLSQLRKGSASTAQAHKKEVDSRAKTTRKGLFSMPRK